MFVRCSENEKHRKIRIGNVTIEGNISRDTILNGLITYYNNDIVVSKANFTNGVKSGDSINYYLNGSKKNVISFFYGKKTGRTYEFDSASGNPIYQGFYYFGRLMGPNYWYYRDGKIKQYDFSDFEGKSIFYASYDSNGNVSGSSDQNQFFPMHIAHVDADNKTQSFLFIYNLQPPHFLFSYKVCIEDSLRKIIETIDSVPKQNIYFEKLLPQLKDKNKYCVVLNIVDSTNNKPRTLIREIINEREGGNVDNVSK
jgi:hypothetical protein